MTRSELVQILASNFSSLTQADVDVSVRVILEAISQELCNGGWAEIRGFGSFVLNIRPPRLGRNPKTGVKVNVPAKHAPHFKAGKELRVRVNAINN